MTFRRFLPVRLRAWSRRSLLILLAIFLLVVLGGGGAWAALGRAPSSNTAAATDVNLQKGLAGWWKLSGNAKDSTPYANDGLLSGISVVQSTGTGRAAETTGISLAWPSATTAGDTLIAVVTTNNGRTFTAPAGWSTLTSASGQGGYYVFEIVNAASRSGTETFTNSSGLIDDTGLWLTELAGVDTTTPNGILQTYSNTTTASAPTLGPTAVGANGGIAVAVASAADGSGNAGTISTAGWTSSVAQRGGFGYELVNGYQEVSAVYNSTVKWQAVMLSFNAASATRPSATTDRKGKASGAYSFNGTNNYIKIPDANKYSPSVDGYVFSVSVWAMIPVNASPIGNGSCSGSGGYLAAKGSAGQFEWGLENDTNSKICFNLYTLTGSGAGSAGTNRAMNDGLWHLYTATVSPSSLSLYIDGNSVASNTVSQTMGNGTAPVYLGSRDGTSNFMFAGSLSSMRLYTRTLTATEIQALYQDYGRQISAASGEKGLVGWWNMDGNGSDSTPNSNNLTVTAASLTTDRKGRGSSAYNFNGTTACLSKALGAGNVLDIAGALTLSAWIYPTAGTGTQTIIRAGSGANERYMLGFDGTNKRLSFEDYNGSYNAVTSTNNSVPLASWSHVVVTRDASNNIAFYVNGQAAGTGTVPASTVSAPDFEIGATACGSSQQFTGTIDDARVYNRALSASDVSRQYHSYGSQIGLGGNPGSSINLQKGLVGWWPMNGNIRDATPYSHNGTISGQSLTTDRKLRLQNAYAFNGSSGSITIGNLSYTKSLPFSVSTWFYTTSTPSNGSALINKYVAASNNGFNLFFDASGDLCAWYMVDSSDYTSIAHNCSFGPAGDGPTPALSAWHNVVVTVSTSGMQLYLDGSLYASSSWTGTAGVSTESTTLAFGRYTATFNGSMDDVRIYNRTLSTAEVAALYNEYQ